MASTSVASPSLPITVPSKKYDVFISFRGEDTRGDFTSHLHAALCRNGIETYIDYRIEKGEEVWTELEKAIKDSSVFLVIFSENYASSTWCLNELLEIMECKEYGEADVNKGTDAITNINLRFNAFKKMPSLSFLAFQAFNQGQERVNNSVYLPEGLESLPEKLKYFECHEYPLKTLPSIFCPEKLVKLSLRKSNMEKLWHGVQNLPNLEEIDLWGCKHLIECPNLSGAPNLKMVRLTNCKNLHNVDTSIFALQKLECLVVSGCTSLKSLSSIICSPSLQSLFAGDCFNLHEFCVPFKPNNPSKCFFSLDLGCSGLSILPSSILQLRNLDMFCFPICESLMDLPENFANQIVLSHSSKREHDSLITLQKLVSTSGFRSVKFLHFK